MEEGGLNDIAPEVLHGRLIFRRDAITAEDLESGMTPVGEHGDHYPFPRLNWSFRFEGQEWGQA